MGQIPSGKCALVLLGSQAAHILSTNERLRFNTCDRKRPVCFRSTPPNSGPSNFIPKTAALRSKPKFKLTITGMRHSDNVRSSVPLSWLNVVLVNNFIKATQQFAKNCDRIIESSLNLEVFAPRIEHVLRVRVRR